MDTVLLFISLVAFAALVVGWMMLPAQVPGASEAATSAPAMHAA
ncbi:MAG TPA: hypothetical protein VKZ60_12325 [Chloroflexota bacterium]|jgi:hypothetical protein|nr:hypothetical protein [Chloroflexota bacterium]